MRKCFGKMSRLPWSTQCIKYLLFIFNLLFVITGIILLSVGATIHGVYGTYSTFLDSGGYLSTSAFMIATGLIIFIISFFGCCGAIKENSCMTITFTALLIVIFIFELAAGISGYVLRDNTIEILKESLNYSMSHYRNDSSENQKTIDFMQNTMQCCGVDGPKDWHGYLNSTYLLPLSCCNTTGKLSDFNCTIEFGGNDVHKNGCLQELGNFIKSHAVSLGGVALGIAFVQLIGIAFSCHLSKQIKYQTFAST